jgi:hypothetical protein
MEKQTFELHIGTTYRIMPPAEKKVGMIYLSGICKLLSVYADGRARFENSKGNTFTIFLKDNRIFGY